MDCDVIGFSLPKKECLQSECEDFFEYNKFSYRFAVADIAGNSSYSNKWALILIKDFIDNGDIHLSERLQSLREKWRLGIQWDSLPWNEEEKARRGDCSTFLALSLIPAQNVNEVDWKAVAIGDTCLVQVRENKLKFCFPIKKSSRFNDFPNLLNSIEKNNPKEHAIIQVREGKCYTDDLFIIGTDAISEWFLRSCEKGEKPWLTIIQLESKEDFEMFIDDLRRKGNIKNDDTTLLRIRIKN